MTRCWINTISRDHVLLAVEGGFTQAGHGRATGLRRLGRGDRIAFYSPRTSMRSGEPVQQLTALGTITSAEPYQAEVSPDWRPWRLDVDFEQVTPAPIRPLIDSLAFIPDKSRWGMPFRRGLFEVGADDFTLIEQALRSGSPLTASG